MEFEQSSQSKDKDEKGSVCDQNKHIMHASMGKTTLSAFMDKPFEITETAGNFHMQVLSRPIAAVPPRSNALLFLS